ncbi:MAG: hypothetical protein WBA16_03550 [Nonlabens sp.]
MSLIFCVRCVPVKTPPKIKRYKIEWGHDFYKELPRNHAFIFEDPKPEFEFYKYISTKYDVSIQNADFDVAVEVSGKLFYLSFYEVDYVGSKINVMGMVIDKALQGTALGSVVEDRQGYVRHGDEKWYIVMEARSSDGFDALHPDYKDRTLIVDYLENMRQQYLDLQNYNDALLLD